MKNKKLLIILLLSIILYGCSNKTYTVKFDTLGGTLINSIKVSPGDTIGDIDIPTKEGYLFVNWHQNGIEYNKNSPINKDITLTANWIEAPELLDVYTVTYIVDDKIEKEMVKENTTVNKPNDPNKVNHHFLGWYLNDELYDFNNPITKDITITAKFELDTINIAFDLDGGIGVSSIKIPKNTQPPIPDTPTKEGYKFLKWTIDDKEFSFETKINKDITLKAVWEEIEYITIFFDTDGGNKIEPIIIEKYSIINNLPVPVKENYTFKEWQLDNQPFNIDTYITSDITLKAIYKKL